MNIYTNEAYLNIITRYLIKEFFKPFLLSATTFGGLVLISEFFRELNFYIEKKAPFLYVFEYLLLNLPWWIIQVLPVAVLLAVLFSLGKLARSGEITAIKSAGVNVWSIIGVFIVCGLCIGAGDMLLREKIIPFAVKYAEIVRIEKIKNEKVEVKTEHTNLVISLPQNARLTIGYLNAQQGVLHTIVIDYFDENYVLLRQMVAEKGRWDEQGWVLENGVTRVFDGNAFKESSFTSHSLFLPFKPEDFIHVGKRPEQMSYREQARYVQRLKTLGIPIEKEQIQLYSRLAMPFSHVIVMLIGIPFALVFGGKHGKIISFTFALIFAFIYWAFLAVGQSLGENRVISPLLSAWLGNILFGILGTVMLMRVQK